MNENLGSFQTLTDDLIQQQNYLKDAINYAIHEETDMFIVSKDKEVLHCQKSLLSLFSPDIAYLLSEVPSCASPTIFLPDFLACHIRSFLHILQTGQTLLSEDLSVEVIHTLANVLKIKINTISSGHYLNNPLKIEEVKVEQSIEEQKSSIIKEEIIEDKANSKYVIQEKNQVKEVQVKKEKVIEYVEEEIDEIIKQENNDDLDIDKVLEDTVCLQNFVNLDRKSEDSIICGNMIDSALVMLRKKYTSLCEKNFTMKKEDQGFQEFNENKVIKNKVRLKPISNLVSNEHEPNSYENDDISPRSKKRKISPTLSSESKSLVNEQLHVYVNQVQKSSPPAFTQNQQRAVDTSNSNVTVNFPTVSPIFVQTSTPPPTPILPSSLAWPPTVGHQVTAEMMYPCDQCEVSCVDHKNTRNHHEPFICTKPGCDQKTVGFYQMDRHYQTEHRNTSLAFACKCGCNFNSKNHLLKHQRRRKCLLNKS